MSRVSFGKILKFSRLACNSISLMILTCHGLGMACHGMSRVVTACDGISWDKGGLQVNFFEGIVYFYKKVLKKTLPKLSHSSP
jgi:hypothetical protein